MNAENQYVPASIASATSMARVLVEPLISAVLLLVRSGTPKNEASRRQQGEQRGGHRDHAVDRHIVELVGHREPLAGHDVHPHGLLGRGGEQADGLDQELRDQQPQQVAGEDDRHVEQAGQAVTDDRHRPAVEAIHQCAGDRPEDQVRQQPGQQHTRHRGALREVGRVLGQVGGQRGGGQQAEPVAEAGDRDRRPQPAEDRYAEQHRDGVRFPLLAHRFSSSVMTSMIFCPMPVANAITTRKTMHGPGAGPLLPHRVRHPPAFLRLITCGVPGRPAARVLRGHRRRRRDRVRRTRIPSTAGGSPGTTPDRPARDCPGMLLRNMAATSVADTDMPCQVNGRGAG